MKSISSLFIFVSLFTSAAFAEGKSGSGSVGSGSGGLVLEGSSKGTPGPSALFDAPMAAEAFGRGGEPQIEKIANRAWLVIGAALHGPFPINLYNPEGLGGTFADQPTVWRYDFSNEGFFGKQIQVHHFESYSGTTTTARTVYRSQAEITQGSLTFASQSSNGLDSDLGLSYLSKMYVDHQCRTLDQSEHKLICRDVFRAIGEEPRSSHLWDGKVIAYYGLIDFPGWRTR